MNKNDNPTADINSPDGKKYTIILRVGGWISIVVNDWKCPDEDIEGIDGLDDLMDKLAVKIAPYDEAGMKIWQNIINFDDWR
jgi:hypothetical protein